MTPAEAYRLTPRALADLEAIWRYSAETWSITQAELQVDALAQTFAMIAAMPGLARERPEFIPPVRIHAHDGHLVIYRLVDSQVVILRLLGGRQDWRAILAAAEG
ncbi:MAG: type II toxin-antitoxin system RelE/ParE family toxin [Roseomonas sp.]|nr:type II toxin-antitoxin system RelE/ParE family toxin [Roseomonas sp.]